MTTCSVGGCDRQAVARGWCKRHWQNWNRNGNPIPPFEKNKCGDGTIRNGYRYFTRNYVLVSEHDEVATRALGKPLPPGAVVHHIDHDGLNNAPDNLVVCPSHAYHMLLHKRERALNACGHAGWEPCNFCSRYDDPALMTLSGKQYHHQSCRRNYEAARRATQRASKP